MSTPTTAYEIRKQFVETLEPEYQRIYWWAVNETQVIEDTLSNEFQVASRIVDAFGWQAKFLRDMGV